MKKTQKIRLKGKVIEAEVCDTIWKKARGLMFRKNSMPLLFVFNHPTHQSIHSFFCKPFRAIWLNKGEIIDEKIVQPFSFSVKPRELFTELVEIPLEEDNRN